MNESEKRVKEVWPDVRCVKAVVTDDNGGEGWGYWIDGVPYRLRAKFGSEKAAWADAASRLPKAEAAPDKDEPTCCHGRTAPCSLCNERNVNPCPTLGRTPGALCVFPLGHECPCAIQIYPRFHAPEQATPGGVSASPVEEGEVTAQTFEEWWDEIQGNARFAGATPKLAAHWAWNAAKASSPAVAGGESANLLPDVRIVRLGLGKVVSNWGTSNGVPSVFIEPVLGEVGEVGQKIEDGREPQIKMDSVSAGGVIIEIHDEKGLKVLVEDLWTALHKFNEKHPEPLKCSDCVLIHGKSVCTMNCGPLIKDVRGKE